MSFTDEDLKRLKDSFYGGEGIVKADGQEISLKALIARLEAAESSAVDVPHLCKTFDYCGAMGSYSQVSLDALARHQAWLRSKGESR